MLPQTTDSAVKGIWLTKEQINEKKKKVSDEMRFHCSKLIALLDNETACSKYLLGKQIAVVVKNVPCVYYGTLSTISSDGYIYLLDVHTSSGDYQSGAMFHILKIERISLMHCDEDESKDTDITSEIFDSIKLKTTHDVLHHISTAPQHIFSLVGALNCTMRKMYLNKHTPPKQKKNVASFIMSTDLQTVLDSADVLQWIQFWINDNKTPRYHLYSGSAAYEIAHIQALLLHYHHLWKQHISQHSKDNLDAALSLNKMNDFMAWDEVDLTSDMFRLNMMGTIKKKESKAKHIYIDSIWPYNFFGPCTKLKKNHPDWICMNCKKKNQIMLEHVTFYKARRMDITMEICCECVMRNQAPTAMQRGALQVIQHVTYPEPCAVPYCKDCLNKETGHLSIRRGMIPMPRPYVAPSLIGNQMWLLPFSPPT